MSWGVGPEDVAASAQADADRFRRLAGAVDALRVTRGSPDGEVEVTVDGQGQLVDVHFSDRVRTTDPDRVARELMTCLRRAQAELADRVADLGTRERGMDDAVGAIVDGYRRRFPVPVTRDDPRVPRSRPAVTTWLA